MCRENQKTYFMFTMFFLQNRAVYEITWKKYGAARQATNDNTYAECALPYGQLSLQTHTHNMKYVLLFHGDNGYAHAP